MTFFVKHEPCPAISKDFIGHVSDRANCPHTSNTVSTLDMSGAIQQNTIEPIIISDAVYTGCGTTNPQN